MSDPAAYAIVIAEAARRLREAREWTDEIDAIMASIGEGLGLSRVYIFRIHKLADGGLGQTCVADWASPGLARLSTDSRNIDERILDSDPTMLDWAGRRRRGEMIEGHTRDLAGYLRDDFRHQRIKSFISFPIWQNGQWWGHLGFDDCVRERTWTEAEKAVLRATVYVLADAIALSASSLVMSEATRLAMMRTAPYGIIVIDEAGAILDFNPAAERIFGRAHADVIGRKIAETVIDDGSHAAFARFMHKLELGKAKRVFGKHTVTEGRHANGTAIPIEMAVTEIRHGERRLFVAYVRDLTEVRKTELEVQRQREALHQSEKMTALGSLLAGVAHELNNPLSVVIGRAIMLEEDAKDAVQRERLRKLREAAERCAKVSKTFLAMARQSPARRELMQLNAAIRTALDLVAYSFRSSGIELRLAFDATMPNVTADFDQIVQVFVNLCVNAEHAMRESGETRILTVETGTADGSTVYAEVRDTGSGIRPDVLPRIFEPFFTTKGVGTGTGMGLAVSFGMVTAHGGNLAVASSEPGKGTCFRLTLPATAATAALEAPAPQATASAQGFRVLVVDDDAEVVDLLSDILERAGHRVDRAENGARGLDLAVTASYDAILCDLRMPVLGGRGFRQRLLSEQPRYGSRMAYVTGDLLGTIEPNEYLDGCPVVEKPFHARVILETLEAITAGGSLADSVRRAS